MPLKRKAAGSPRGPVAQARLVGHDETGWQLIQLRVQERPPDGPRLEALIAPAAGSNLFSLAVDGHELLLPAGHPG